MKNKVFGEMNFNSGWEKPSSISLFGKKYNIAVYADAYFEKDGITEEQEKSYKHFLDNEKEIVPLIEAKVSTNDFTPALLHFKRNGDYGLIFDDNNDVEGGIVITIKPKMQVLSVDQYL